MKNKILILLLATTSFSLPALAASPDEMEARIKQLESKLARFEKMMDSVDGHIEKEVNERLQQSIANIQPAAGGGSSSDVEFKLKPAPSFKTKDGSTTFALDGRIAVDAGFVDEDNADIQGNATDIRYAWLGAKGKIANDWAYRVLVGLENDATTVNDVWMAYNGFDNVSIKLGNFKEFQGIEAMSSNLHNTLQERSASTTTFRPLRNIGLASTFYGDQWSLQAGVFGDDPGNTDADDEGHSVTGRFVVAPILDKANDHVLHLGVSSSYRAPDDTDDSVRYRARGDSNVINARLVDTGTIANVDNAVTYAAEARYTNGPFSLMGEYNYADVNRSTGTDLGFDGGYVSASYFLTGEQRGYKVKNGTYGRVKPNNPFDINAGGAGAWEVAARYSTLDLNDSDITGGELDSYTLGVNWYPTKNTKFMLNYIMNETDQNGTTPNNDPQYVTLRGQIDF